jgi:Fe-Mn family superoxide dismutase
MGYHFRINFIGGNFMNIDRRTFLAATSALAATTAYAQVATPDSAAKSGLELPKLPWEANALDPVISSRTVGIHYGKHHKGYLDNLNRLLTGTPMAGRSLDDVVKASSGKADQVAVFNNAAQTWNHTFYWQSLSPKGGGKPGAELLGKMDASFGSMDEFRKAFLAASAGQFGAGWVWLVANKASKKLSVVKTGNADTPLTDAALVPLAVLDVWEHAYYLDYENRRADYAVAVLDKLFNWRFVEENLAKV